MEDSSICSDEDVATQVELEYIEDSVELSLQRTLLCLFVNGLKCLFISIYGESKLNRGDRLDDHPAAVIINFGVASGAVEISVGSEDASLQ